MKSPLKDSGGNTRRQSEDEEESRDLEILEPLLGEEVHG